MTVRIGDVAPDFTAETTEGKISFHDWIGGKWAGDDVIIPTSVSDEDAKKKYPAGFKTLKPYLLTVKLPK